METLNPDLFLDHLSTQARKKRTPYSAFIELTYSCNLACVHCYNPTHKASPEELTTAEIKTLLGEIAEMNIVVVTFTGGEALRRPDILELMREADRLGLIINLMTNAVLLTKDILDELSKLRIGNIHVSVYGASAETYKKLTGSGKSYEKCMNALKLISERTIPSNIRMPVMTLNVHELKTVQEFVRSLGLQFHFMVDMHPGINGDKSPLQYALSAEEKVRLKKEFSGYDSDALRVDTECMERGEFITCQCGQTQFVITPYGEMNLCTSFPIPRYNLRKGSLKEGWEVLKQTVDEAGPNENYECPDCELRSYCWQGRNDAWLATGDMSRCLPDYKEWAALEKKAYEGQP